MTAAFDLSPGGCCCDPKGGPFDIWGLLPFNSNFMTAEQHPTGLTRYGVMWPPSTSANLPTLSDRQFNAYTQFEWSLPPAVAPAVKTNLQSLGTLCGGRGDNVWSLEGRDGTTNRVIALYRPTGEVKSMPGVNFPFVQLPVTTRLTFANRPNMCAANANELFTWQSGTVPSTLYNSDGTSKTIAFTGGGLETYQVAREGGPLNGQNASMIRRGLTWLISGRDWPNAVRLSFQQRSVWTGTGSNYYSPTDVRFYRVRLNVSGNTVPFAYDDGTTIYEYRTALNLWSTVAPNPEYQQDNAQWLAWDSTHNGDKNVGVMCYYKLDSDPGVPVPGSTIRAYTKVIVNDAEVQLFSTPFESTATGSPNRIVRWAGECVPFGSIHACYDGKAFMSRNDFAQQPTMLVGPTYTIPNKPQYGVMLSGSGVVWQTNPVGAIGGSNSSEEWVYISGFDRTDNAADFVKGFAPSGTFPHETYTMGNSQRNPAWLVKPDGSQAMPAGHLHQFGQKFINPPRGVAGGYDCVKEPASIPYTLPGDANDLEDALQGSIT